MLINLKLMAEVGITYSLISALICIAFKEIISYMILFNMSKFDDCYFKHFIQIDAVPFI